jgi:glycosyltransferase involved in cell wall biosynthesis
MKSALKKAKKVIAISEATKDDLIRLFKADENKIRVIYEGPGLVEKVSLETTPAGFDLPDKYLLYVGNLKTHKNVTRLIKAYLQLEKWAITENLLIVGKLDEKSPASPELRLLIESNPERIRHLPVASPEQLAMLYKRSRGVVMPSLWEGFGLPVLEAFQAGVPVACSMIPSHREIAGDEGLYFNPEDIGQIKDAIHKMLTDASAREALIRNGSERLKLFSWKKCAAQTLEVYREAVGQL